jgi:predicted DNA-binding transcriptional regulator AlpA
MGMSVPWLYREARAGRLPFARRIGRRLVFDRAECTRWLARRPPR